MKRNEKIFAVIGYGGQGGCPTRDEIMGYEAIKFADYIENKNTENDYREVSELTHTVHTCMDLIKQSAGIKYPIKKCNL